MNGFEASTQDLHGVIRGDHMEVWNKNHLLYAGTVDEVDPAHGVVWIHEDGSGERKMIHAQQYHLRYHPTARPH